MRNWIALESTPPHRTFAPAFHDKGVEAVEELALGFGRGEGFWVEAAFEGRSQVRSTGRDRLRGEVGTHLMVYCGQQVAAMSGL